MSKKIVSTEESHNVVDAPSHLASIWSEIISDLLVVCPACGGTGVVEYERPDQGWATREECRGCWGDGIMPTDKGEQVFRFVNLLNTRDARRRAARDARRSGAS